MENYDQSIEINHNINWPYTQQRPFRILIIHGSRLGKTNVLLNFKDQRIDIDKVYLHVKDLFESKYQLLINRREKLGIRHKKSPKAYIDNS